MKYRRKTIEKWKFDAIVVLAVALLLAILARIGTDFTGNIFSGSTHSFEVVAKEVEVEKQEKLTPITLKVSHYNPDLGGTNCANFVDGECISNMANGQDWREWIGEAIACPKELEFGTVIRIDGREWTCRDRGGAIKKHGDVYWIDQLTPYALVPYGTIVQGEIVE